MGLTDSDEMTSLNTYIKQSMRRGSGGIQAEEDH